MSRRKQWGGNRSVSGQSQGYSFRRTAGFAVETIERRLLMAANTAYDLGSVYPSIYPTTSGGGFLQVADLNHDGNADLVTTPGSQTDVAVSLGTGSYQSTSTSSATDYGPFNPPTIYKNVVQSVGALLVADVNGDGFPDIIVGDGAADRIAVLLNQGNGTFGAPIYTSLGDLSPTNLAVADINKDGKADLIAVGFKDDYVFEGGIVTLTGNGNGTFGNLHTYAPSFESNYTQPFGLAVGDFNGDGYSDFVVTQDAVQPGYVVFTNQKDGTFTAGPTVSLGAVIPHDVVAGDFNHDGKIDLAFDFTGSNVLGYGTPTTDIDVVMGIGNGTFSAPTTYTFDNADDYISTSNQSLAYADLNNDGNGDLICSTEGEDTNASDVFVLYGAANGTFSVNQKLSGLSPAGPVQVADLNNDGLPDIVQGQTAYPNLDVFYGFSSTIVFTGGSQPYTGSPATITANVDTSAGETGTPDIVNYYLASDTSFSNPIADPTDVGSYVIRATFNGQAPLPAVTATMAFSITPATPVVTFPGSQQIGYTGSPVVVPTNVVGSYGVSLGAASSLTFYSQANPSTPISAPTNIGAYQVTATYTGNGGYSGASASETFNIVQGTPTVTVSVPAQVAYGTPVTATGSAVGGNGANLGSVSITYYNAADTSLSSPLSAAPTAPGMYLAVASFAGNTYYLTTSSIPAAFQIVAAQLMVTTTVDENNGNSDPSNGTGTSLREALIYAESLGGSPIITFAPSLAGKTINVSDGWNGTTDDTALRVSGNITIDGGGVITLDMDSTSERRLLLCGQGSTLTLQGLALTGGYLQGQNDGGAVWSDGTVVLQNDTFNNDQANSGGAVYSSGPVTIQNCTFTNDSATSGNPAYVGGAVWCSNTLTIQGSTFADNYGSCAGAIYSTGTTSISSSTFTSNTSNNQGGAIESTGALTITGSTFVGNSNLDYGGAIYVDPGSPSLTLQNSTFYGNVAVIGSAIWTGATTNTWDYLTVTGNGQSGYSGTLGIYQTAVTMLDSIVADNVVDYVRTNIGNDSGTFTATSSNNIVTGGGWTGLDPTLNQMGVSAAQLNLGSLGNYGGPTQTFPLLNGSVAIGGAVPISGITTDQRGLARPAASDIGAYQSTASYYLRLDPDGVDTDLWTSAHPVGTYALQLSATQMNGLTLVATGTGTVTLDESNGLLTSGITIIGNSATSLDLIGTGSGDSVTASASQLTIDGKTANFSGTGSVSYDPLGGTNSLNVTGGTLNLTAPIAGAGITSRVFSTIQIGAGATLKVPAADSESDRTVVTTSTLSIAGTTNAWTGLLDLAANDLIVHGGNVNQLQNQIAEGFGANGNWSGEGITSSAAASDPSHLTTLGLISNQNGQGGAIYGSGTSAGTFDGQNTTASDVLIKYTYFGDTTLDGKVDGSDYSKIDNGYLNHATGWENGDLNDDGVIYGSDYTLIDNAFNQQAASRSLTAAVNFSTGFSNAANSLSLTGSAAVTGNNLQLTANSSGQIGSAYYKSALNVSRFSTAFTFNQNAGAGDGFTFTIQNSGLNALGGGGGSLGYAGIGNSLAIKFDLYDNTGEGPDSTGLFLNGAAPGSNGSIDLRSSGIDLHSGDTFRAAINYDGATLTVILTDLNTGVSATQAYAVNIASVIGSNTAYFGFTGATGGATALQQISLWTIYSG
jgi:predicted outer membrane repeat protein